MKILNKEKKIKKKFGKIEILVESEEDLWHLQYILEIDDLIYSLTKRKVDTISDKIRPDKLEKKNVYLGLKILKIEFHDYSNRLRVSGIIISGIDIGLNHTLNIDIGTKIVIEKNEWKNDQVNRIIDAEKYSNSPKIIFVGVEEGEADISIIKHYGIDSYAHIQKSSGKRYIDLHNDFFQEVLNKLLSLVESLSNILILLYGPGFIKDNFLNYIEKKDKNFCKKIIVRETSSIGIGGYLELLKSGCLEKITINSRIEEEAKYIDKLLIEIATDGKAIYGYAEILQGVETGSIDTLLITDEFLKDKRVKKQNIDDLLKLVESLNGKIVIFSTKFNPGIKLKSLGGIAALLKYKIY